MKRLRSEMADRSISARAKTNNHEVQDWLRSLFVCNRAAMNSRIFEVWQSFVHDPIELTIFGVTADVQR